MRYVDAMIQAIAMELKMQKDYLAGEQVQTIYFGGGTPSLLNKAQINLLLSEIYQHYNVCDSPEITIEANPDDLTYDKLALVKAIGFNRLSIGVQSFDDSQLSFMNRAHTASEALESIRLAKSVGLDDITIDLIYGIPNTNLESWRDNLAQAIELKIPHISAYCLTIEPGTVFGHRYRKNKLLPLDEDLIVSQFELLVKMLSENGYVHYEISNFCLPGRYSQHNSNYWKLQKYLGVGPSAHSFNLDSRQASISNNHSYIATIRKGKVPSQIEKLTDKDKANEYLLTGLRTHWGCNLHFLKREFQIDLQATHAATIDKYTGEGLIEQKNGVISLTTRGKILADSIIQDFFIS